LKIGIHRQTVGASICW